MSRSSPIRLCEHALRSDSTSLPQTLPPSQLPPEQARWESARTPDRASPVTGSRFEMRWRVLHAGYQRRQAPALPDAHIAYAAALNR